MGTPIGSPPLDATDAASLVRDSIEDLLRQYVRAPLFNGREKDYQAVLFGMLRTKLPETVPAKFVEKNGRPNSRHLWSDEAGAHTSRVHLELGFGQKGLAGAATKPDLVVFRDHPVTLRCSPDGPADIQDSLQVDDVEVAIEVKAAPSKNSGEAAKFAADVIKLAKLQCAYPELRCFAVVIDKTVSTPFASSVGLRAGDWLERVTSLERRATRSDGPVIEVGYIDPQKLVPTWAFFTSTGISP